MEVERRYFILLGSNVGNRSGELEAARQLLSDSVGLPDRISAIYETAAWGKTDQQAFLNQVITGKTRLGAEEVMQQALAAEQRRGRVRGEKWAPRTIDIDLLFLDDQQVTSPLLTLPHPMLHLRKFTLVPLCEIFPDFRHPILGQTLSELLDQLDDPLPVQRYSLPQ